MKKVLRGLAWVVAFPVAITKSLAGNGPRRGMRAAVIAVCWALYAVLIAGAVSMLWPKADDLTEAGRQRNAASPKEEEVDPNAILPREVVIDKKYLVSTVGVGEFRSVVAVVLPVTADDKSLKWTSSDESIATVDKYGNVTGVSTGTAEITAETCNGMTASCDIRIAKALPVSISFEFQKIDPNVNLKDWNAVIYIDTDELTIYGLDKGCVYDKEYFLVQGRECDLSVNMYCSKRGEIKQAYVSLRFTPTEEDLRVGKKVALEGKLDDGTPVVTAVVTIAPERNRKE